MNEILAFIVLFAIKSVFYLTSFVIIIFLFFFFYQWVKEVRPSNW